MLTLAYVGLGSNLGDRLAALRLASAAITQAAHSESGGPLLAASLYETTAVGVEDQPSFLNSVVRIATAYSPRDLITHLLGIEQSMGRVRTGRWGSRVIDLDLLLYGNAVVDEAGLHVPHPRMHERRFVLEPLAEIASDAIHPVLKKSIAELVDQARGRFAEQRVARIEGPTWAEL